MLLAAGREVVSKTSAYNITKLSYRVEVRVVRDVIIPIFSHEDLASDDLLSKCLHGQTQKVNESFNMHLGKGSKGNICR